MTARQREVLRCVERGMTNRRIAEELGMSTQTVKNHLSAVFLRLGVTRRVEAAVMQAKEDMRNEQQGVG